MQLEEAAFTAAIYASQVGHRWRANAVCVRIPMPHTAISLLRSAWCRSGSVREAVGERPRRALNDDRDVLWAGTGTSRRTETCSQEP